MQWEKSSAMELPYGVSPSLKVLPESVSAHVNVGMSKKLCTHWDRGNYDPQQFEKLSLKFVNSIYIISNNCCNLSNRTQNNCILKYLLNKMYIYCSIEAISI